MTTDLIMLIYASSATNLMLEADLVVLLQQARVKNERLDITGMLLYRCGNIMQVLEGKPEAVEALFETIAKDPRHHDVHLLVKRPIQTRTFTEWEMGFVNLNNVDPKQFPGYSDFLNAPFDSERFQDDNFAHTFLKVFKESMR